MESGKIELILEKYFEGATTTAEEKELKDYFSSSGVAAHLLQYQSMFRFFSQENKVTSQRPVVFKKKRKTATWLSLAASVVVLLGAGTFTYLNYNTVSNSGDLGTYDNPQEAFRQTQKALALLSGHVNAGVESVKYVKTYEETKQRVFK